ncbi:MAG: branched-chain-amino-acid transaminase [Planctomycetota bacterium]|nr:branched-chain-amino-acid transaminase [Planctomycetota bacterium]MEC8734186.1 branched-chain-amino-acid transaminase [Planctomycetota bacterium]MEC9158725.1 branched-chain-amino-acid transaminase [Planctomycetota bacterium]MEC9232927.1 branched-chain-amino-acid transaminase [Planctomycetota bacterium]MED5507266.1 branched-chain-amino-acid transaminase [Planctomycetota bacterium]
MKIWIDGQLVPQDEAKVSVMDHGLLYGDGCFEGIRIYNGRIFKLGSHLRRMWDSAEEIRLKSPYSMEEVERAIRETVSANQLTDGYIRLVFTRGVGTLGLHPFLCPVPTVFVIADTIKLYPQELYESGMQIIVAERRRVPRECLDPQIKSLNYLNNILAKIEAIDAGVLEALMLNMEGWVSECTGDNVFVVKDGAVFTPPPDAGILNGITRQFLIDDLGPSLGLPIQEKLFRLEEVYQADELFLTGTAAEVIGVTRIGDRVIGDGTVGPITRRFVSEFRARVSADAPED